MMKKKIDKQIKIKIDVKEENERNYFLSNYCCSSHFEIGVIVVSKLNLKYVICCCFFFPSNYNCSPPFREIEKKKLTSHFCVKCFFFRSFPSITQI